MSKNGHVHEGGKVGRSNATAINFFSVDFYILKSLLFKFGNDTFIIFEMPRVSYNKPDRKIYISLQFRPSVIRGPWVNTVRNLVFFFVFLGNCLLTW
jgi:hypothetical protein